MDDHESSVVSESGIDARHGQVRRRVVKLAVILVPAAVIVIGGVIAWSVLGGAKDKVSSDSSGRVDSSAADQSLVLSDDYDGTIRIFKDKLADAASRQDKVDTYHDMALLSVNNDKLGQALTYAREANAIQPSASSWGVIGIALEKQEKWQEAADAYAKAVSLSEKTDSDARSDYTYYTSKRIEAEAHL